eukprot:5106162-Pyramimonas_sp.AAC.1
MVQVRAAPTRRPTVEQPSLRRASTARSRQRRPLPDRLQQQRTASRIVVLDGSSALSKMVRQDG